jgi:hypothetical protein
MFFKAVSAMYLMKEVQPLCWISHRFGGLSVVECGWFARSGHGLNEQAFCRGVSADFLAPDTSAQGMSRILIFGGRSSKGSVDNVHTFHLGLPRTAAGLPRIPHVSATSQQ